MLLGLPWWLWAILAIVGAIGLKVRSFYGRYRAFCRGIREDLSALLHQQHPKTKVLREQMGNLVVRMPDGSEKVWEMAEVYTRVLQQHGMGSNASVRGGIYRDAVSALFAPDPAAPVTLATHGERILPQIVPSSVVEAEPDAAQIVHEPVPGLGLETIYLLDFGMSRRPLREADLETLGIGRGTLHRTALGNLRHDFPAQIAADVHSCAAGTAFQMNDGFDAARILLIPELLRRGEQVVAMLPHRDMLLLLPPGVADDSAGLAEALTALGDGHSAGCNHPHLLDRAVRVTRDGFELI